MNAALIPIPGMGLTFGPPTDAELGYLPDNTECATDTCQHPPEDHADGGGPCDWCPCDELREDLP